MDFRVMSRHIIVPILSELDGSVALCSAIALVKSGAVNSMSAGCDLNGKIGFSFLRVVCTIFIPFLMRNQKFTGTRKFYQWSPELLVYELVLNCKKRNLRT